MDNPAKPASAPLFGNNIRRAGRVLRSAWDEYIKGTRTYRMFTIQAQENASSTREPLFGNNIRRAWRTLTTKSKSS
jgi:hypothetical protein